MLRRRIMTTALAVLLTAGMAGCEDLLGPDVEGTYRLLEINRAELPVNVAYVDADNRVLLEEGTATLRGDGTYTQVMSGRMWVSGSVSDFSETSRGDWEADSESITFHDENGRTATADIASYGMVMDDGGNIMKWEKD